MKRRLKKLSSVNSYRDGFLFSDGSVDYEIVLKTLFANSSFTYREKYGNLDILIASFGLSSVLKDDMKMSLDESIELESFIESEGGKSLLQNLFSDEAVKSSQKLDTYAEFRVFNYNVDIFSYDQSGSISCELHYGKFREEPAQYKLIRLKEKIINEQLDGNIEDWNKLPMEEKMMMLLEEERRERVETLEDIEVVDNRRMLT